MHMPRLPFIAENGIISNEQLVLGQPPGTNLPLTKENLQVRSDKKQVERFFWKEASYY